MQVRRYKDFYAISNSTDAHGKTGAAQVEVSSDESDDDEDDMRDLLDRFVDEIAARDEDERAVPTRRSFEDLRDFYETDDDKSTHLYQTARRPAINPRFGMNSSPPSPSIYSQGDRRSRGSFLDAEMSEDARERFVQRVEAMYDESGREKPKAVVPPVPRLPAGVVGQRWGRF